MMNAWINEPFRSNIEYGTSSVTEMAEVKHASNPSRKDKLIPIGTILVRWVLSFEVQAMMSYPWKAKKQMDAAEKIWKTKFRQKS